MNATLLPVVLASLAGSLHCAGMCGPFAAFYAEGAPTRAARARAQAGYHLARLLTYSALGALAGAAGAALDLASRGLGLRSVAGVVAGALLVAWGAAALLRHAGLRLPRLPYPAGLGPRVARAIGGLRSLPSARRAVAVGLLTTLLPCGWLHAFVLAAAATGSAPAGLAVMAAFWAGTVPVLALVAGGVAALRGAPGAVGAPGAWRRRAPAVASLVVVLLGVVALARNGPGLAAAVAGRGALPCHAPSEAAP